MKDLARRLLAVEAARHSEAYPHVREALRVYEKLRVSLTRFAGSEGFTALMRRALNLARADVPSLEAVCVRPDGSIDGLEDVSGDAGEGGLDATVALTAHLLALLVVFVGEPLTRRLISDAWPDTALDEPYKDIGAL